MGYTDPELMSGEIHRPTSASDMWAFGIMMFLAANDEKHPPPLLPERNGIEMTKTPVSGSLGSRLSEEAWTQLRQMVAQLLKRNPEDRLSANEVLCHPFFFTSFSSSSSSSSGVPSSSSSSSPQNDTISATIDKSRVFRSQLPRVKPESRWNITIRRDRLLEDVEDAFSKATPDELKKCIRVKFEGEAGIDEGGLTADLFSNFFRNLPKSPFLTNSLGDADLDSNAASTSVAVVEEDAHENSFFVPSRRAGETVGGINFLKAMGRVLAKCVLDRTCSIPVVLSPFLFKYLVNEDLVFSDLEQMDQRKCSGIHRMMASRNVERLGMTFGQVARASGGAFREDTVITDLNKWEFQRLCVKWYLVESRRKSLEAFREGFKSVVPEIQSGLATLRFSGRELMMLCCGTPEPLSCRVLKRMIVFDGFAADSPTPRLLEELFEEMHESDPQSLNVWFEFVTGLPTLPLVIPSGKGRITVRRASGDVNGLPLAHTCFWTIDIPDYRDRDLLRQKMRKALGSFQNTPFLHV